MTSLSHFSEEELLKEIERRKTLKTPEPKIFTECNFTYLSELCKKYIENLATGNDDSEDFKNYIFEAAIEAVYGEQIWKWVNEMS